MPSHGAAGAEPDHAAHWVASSVTRERLRQRERARVQRLADDRALDADGGQAGERTDVVQRAHAAGGDDRPRRRGADLAQQVEVGTAQRAVLGDVGDHVPGAALGVQPGEGLVELAALLGPAAGGQPGAADVEADGDPVAVLGDRPGAPLRRLQRGGAEVHPAAAGGQGRGQRLVVADAAGELHVDVELADHAGQQLAVAAAAEGGVEVDQVDPLGAVPLPLHGRVQRVAVGRLAAGLPLHETDGLAVGDVDGGEELQLRHGDQPRSARPVLVGALRQAVAVEFAEVVRRRRMVRDYDPDRPVPAGGPGAAARARHPRAVGRVQPGLGVPGARDARGARPVLDGDHRWRRAGRLAHPDAPRAAADRADVGQERLPGPLRRAGQGLDRPRRVPLAGAVLGRRRRAWRRC